MSATLRVISGGAQTTVQDQGRLGALRYGVPRGGAMDAFALGAANRLVGNRPDAAGLEILVSTAAFEVLRPIVLALTGAPVDALWNERPLPPWTAIMARAGDQLVLPARRGGWGARAYLAVSGGIDVTPVLGSRSTHLPGKFGGLAGRPLRAGDVLAAGTPAGDPLVLAGREWPADARPAYQAMPTLRYVLGPHAAAFAADALPALAGGPLRVSEHANRMGYRLEGVHLAYAGEVSLSSLGVIPGAIQVPPDGVPILLMADAQTTGGYPIIGVVIGPDLPLAAQLLPGDKLLLLPVMEDEALAARRASTVWRACPRDGNDSLELLNLAGSLP